MGKRWKILIAIGLSVAFLDQWTKLLAIKHLTPGMMLAHAARTAGDPEASGRPSAASGFSDRSVSEASAAAQTLRSRPASVDDIGWFESIQYFYGGVERPCDGALRSQCPTVTVIDGLWNWRYVENPGAAWGILSTASDGFRVPFFLVVSLGALVFILGFFRKLDDRQTLLMCALSSVFGGAIGNFIDRLHLSYVIDFIDWHVGTAHWPTFNVADAGITCGVGLLLIEWVRDWWRARDAKDDDESARATTEGA
ncbi:MAG: signal peptidase II [Deltaproteobacteria bacterium]|nr:signal peptidase II [Deltaproteobacteria bacterium]